MSTTVCSVYGPVTRAIPENSSLPTNLERISSILSGGTLFSVRELHLISGCTVARHVPYGVHVGASEYIVKKGAKLSLTMIHSWNLTQNVQPRTKVVLEEGATLVSVYVLYNPPRRLATNPVVELVGDNARAVLVNVVVGDGSANLDVGGVAYLRGNGSSAQLISRVVAKGGSHVTSRATLVGEGSKTKGHIECMGLMLSESSSISTVPILEAKSRDTSLTHEAAVGKIAESEVNYLMAKGLSRSEAISMLVRGYLNIDAYLKELPPTVSNMVRTTLDFVSSAL